MKVLIYPPSFIERNAQILDRKLLKSESRQLMNFLLSLFREIGGDSKRAFFPINHLAGRKGKIVDDVEEGL